MKPFPWMLGFLATILVSIMGIWLNNLSTDMRSFQAGAAERTARITGVETTQTYTNQKLDSMEKKIDLVIDKLNTHMMEKK